MGVERRFLGWETPVLDGVCAHLLAHTGTRCTADFAGVLIVVPTRQAGRRLREALARRCDEQGKALLSARVVTPAFFLRSESDVAEEASPTIVKAVWADVLGRVAPEEYEGIFPAGGAPRDPAWAMYMGEMIQGVRNVLVDGGYLMKDVVSQYGDVLEEANRWGSMARLESLYLEDLSRIGLCDPCDLRVHCADTHTPSEAVERIVICAVPDPSPLAVCAWSRLSSSFPVDVLVHAPGDMSSRFDTWGRPLPDAWISCAIPVPAPDANIALCGSPASQAQEILEILAAESGRFGPDDVAIGVPDRSAIPFIEACLAGHGLVAFDPADRPVSEHTLYLLLEAYCDLVCDGGYRSLAAILRHPDFLTFVVTSLSEGRGTERRGATPLSLLRELDEFQNMHLPNDMDDMLLKLQNDGTARRFTHLRQAMEIAQKVRADFSATSVESAARAFLQDVYASRTVSNRNAEDLEFAAVAGEVDEALREVSDPRVRDLGLSSRQVLRLFVRRVGEQRFRAEGDEADVDLEGWLELHWNDAPLLIVTGMNEGNVPDSRLSDVFLPDSLRRTLKLRDDRHRLARDSYLMRCVVESRRHEGRACFIAGKTSSSGDPLKPSRLLFRCSEEALPRRAARLFGPVAEMRENPPASVSFQLDPWWDEKGVRRGEAVAEMSVTAFRAYLSCPLRYYLGRRLRMQPLDDEKANLDALDFGNLIHDALAAMHCEETLQSSCDVERLASFLSQRADGWVRDRFGAQPSLPVLITLEAAKQRLASAAREHVQLVAQGWETLRAESTFTCVLAGVTLKGKIDRLDRHRETGALRIIDYKTSDRAISPEAAHLAPCGDDTPDYQCVSVNGKARRWIDLQLPLYELLVSGDDSIDGEKHVAYFNLPKSVGHTGIAAWNDLTPDIAASARSCAQEVIERVCRGEFWPGSERLRYDDYAALFPRGVVSCVRTPDGEGVDR